MMLGVTKAGKLALVSSFTKCVPSDSATNINPIKPAEAPPIMK